MKITIVGPGALGCLLASYLLREHNDVWILDRNEKRARLLHKQGIILEEGGKTFLYPVRATADPRQIGQTDLILICIKSHQVEEALIKSASLFGNNNLAIAFQNGISHIDILQDRVSTPWALCITSFGATLLDPGHVRLGGKGLCKMGFIGSARDTARRQLICAVKTFTLCGIETEISDNIVQAVWAKLIINVGINALTAINGCPNGKLVEDLELKTVQEKAVLEASEVAKAKGITLQQDPVAMTENVCRSTALNISSMLQDIRKKRKTEIDAINGAVVEEAKKHHISVPVNTELVRRVKRIEKSYLF